jgi:hypothetical protein
MEDIVNGDRAVLQYAVSVMEFKIHDHPDVVEQLGHVEVGCLDTAL